MNRSTPPKRAKSVAPYSAWLVLALASAATACGTRGSGAPASPQPSPKQTITASASAPFSPRREPFEEILFGIHLVDPYRWMEKKENAPEVTNWLSAQGEQTRQHLEQLPGHRKLQERVRELGVGQGVALQVKAVDDMLFYLRVEKGGNRRKLVLRMRDGPERVLLDPESAPGAQGKHVNIDHFQPSKDGRWVAYGVSERGSEITAVHLLETKTGRALPDLIPGVWGEHTVSWREENDGFYYSQMAPEKEQGSDPHLNGRVRFHLLGEPPDRDVTVLGRALAGGPRFEPQEFPKIQTNARSTWAISLGLGARAEARIFVAKSKNVSGLAGPANWRSIAEYTDRIEEWAVHGDDLYVLSMRGTANGKVLRVSLPKGSLAAAVMIATGLQDARVSPWISAKFGAQMQWANAGQRAVRMRVDPDDGHGASSARLQRLDRFADMWSFFLEEMGDPEFQIQPRLR